jgi:hypothetical protein
MNPKRAESEGESTPIIRSSSGMYGLSRVLRVPIPFLNGGTESDFCVLTAAPGGRVAVSVLQRQLSPKLGVKGFIPSRH